MHRRLSDAAGDTDDVPFLEYDQELMGAWRDRAAGAGVAPAVLAAHERVAPRLAASSRSVIHGEFYASNVLVQVTGSDELVEVWPVDWELAGRGPAVLDVAALTAGRWGATERAMMARAYFDAAGHDPASWPAWCADLDAARLHLCVQWLGWKPGWVPPPEHRHDWLAEAVVLMERL
jgi:Ser/Thr protein kinase RdoA (MazF antagonist)